MDNNTVARAIRPITLGRKGGLVADCGGDRGAIVYSLISTAKLNGVDSLTWLTDVLARIGNHPMSVSPRFCSGTGSRSRPPSA